MLEMGVGFTLGHLAPTAFLEESLHEAVDVRGADILRDVANFLESLVVMLLDGDRAAIEIREGMPMRGQSEIDAVDLTHPVERIEEGLEWVGEVRNSSDMRCDGGQDMIAGQERARFGIVQTDVIGGMAGCVEYEPFPAGQFDDVAVFDMVRNGREEFAATDGGEIEPSQSLSNFASFRSAFPRSRRRDAFEGAKEIAYRVLCTTPVAFEQFHVNGQIVDRRFAVMIVGTVIMGMGIRMISRVTDLIRRPPEMESPMRHDLGTRLLVDTDRTTEMIGMGMGNENRVDVTGFEASLFEAVQNRIPGSGAGESGIDHGGAVVIDQGVHIHMAQAGNADGQLHAKNVLRDFRDLLLGVFLLLSFRSAHDRRL